MCCTVWEVFSLLMISEKQKGFGSLIEQKSKGFCFEMYVYKIIKHNKRELGEYVYDASCILK